MCVRHTYYNIDAAAAAASTAAAAAYDDDDDFGAHATARERDELECDKSGSQHLPRQP